jgi:hypothetical protein
MLRYLSVLIMTVVLLSYDGNKIDTGTVQNG